MPSIWKRLTQPKAEPYQFQEAEELLSDLRLGVDCGVLAGVAPHKLNQLIYQIKPACLETAAGRPLEPEERDGARADLLRQALREIQEGE